MIPCWGVTLTFHTFVIYHSSQIRSETISRIKENLFLEKMKHIGNVLSELDLYKTYRITDATMGIKNKLHTGKVLYRITKITVKHRKYFIHVIGFYEFPILVYNYIIGGNIPSTVFVFKADKGDADTSVQVKQELEVCI